MTFSAYEQTVGVSGLHTQTGEQIKRPSITFATGHATYGTYIKSIKANGITWEFDPCSMFGVGVWHAANGAATELTNQSWTPTITEAEGTGVVTVLLSLASPYTGITFTFTMTPTPDGYDIGCVTTNTNATYGVEWVEFPRLACKPHSEDADNAYLAYGFAGGCTLKAPHNFTFNTFTTAPEAPSSMQFWDYFDASTKAHLYVSTDDDDGYLKRWNLTGDSSSIALQGWRHFYQNPRRAGNGSGVMPYTQTYNTRIAVFRGRTADGRMGGYDSALRYRDWATHSDRPWMTQGAWAAAAGVSSRVKSSDLYYVQSSPTPIANHWTTFTTDMVRLKTYIGATHMLTLWYTWGANMNDLIGADFLPPAFEPLDQAADQNTALGTAATNNIHVSLYHIPNLWDNSLTTPTDDPFAFDGFVGDVDYGSIHDYIIRDHDDNDITSLPSGPFLPVEP